MPRVIAVAGPIGAGKTCLVNGLVKSLPDASAVYFDHYQQLTDLPLPQMMRWLEQGPDVNQLEIPVLASHLEQLKRGEPVVDPLTKHRIRPSSDIVVEMPLGRAHAEIARHIDYLIWIDLPLDMSLARKMLSHVDPCLAKESAERDVCLRWVDRYLYSYLHGVRRLLIWQAETVRPDADLILDGQLDHETIIQQTIAGISGPRAISRLRNCTVPQN